MGEVFFKRLFVLFLLVVSIFLLVGIVRNNHSVSDSAGNGVNADDLITGFVVHPLYSSFSSPVSGFVFNNTSRMISINDTIMYKLGFYSVNGGAWQNFTLLGNSYNNYTSWLSGYSSYVLPVFGVGEHYVIVYSCMYNLSNSSWDCHDNKWQLIIINNSESSCVDNCSTLGYQCGIQSICGNAVNCGNCTFPQTCNASNMCSCIPESNSVFCTRLNKSCGNVTALDNCGTLRTVSSCGTCSTGYFCAINGTCIINCTTHASSACYNGDVYWYNGCGAIEEIRYDCNSTQTCSNGQCVNNPSMGSQIIADHTVVDRYDDIPQCYIDEVKKMWVSVPGQSHAEAYYTGLLLLQDINSAYSVSLTRSGTPEAYTPYHLRISGAMWGDIDHATGWQYGIDTWDWAGGEPFEYAYSPTQAARVMAGLSYAYNNNLPMSVLGYGWCYNEGYITSYLTATQNFADYCKENNLPTKIFFSTGPADSHLSIADQESYESYLRWKTIREYVAEDPTRVLFDYNDILSYNDEGVQQTKTWNGYTFPVIHPDNMEGDVGEWYSGHIGGNGCLRVGKAMWWMLARLAGWDGVSTDCN